MDPHHRLALTRMARGVAGALFLMVASAAGASAQTSPSPAASPSAEPAPMSSPAPAPAASPAPAPASSPAGQANPGGANNPAPPSTGGAHQVPPRPTLSHLPIIDFVVDFVQPAYYSNMSQLPHYDPIDLGGTVRIPVTRKFSLFFDRITGGAINQPLERQLLATGPNFPKDTRDVILQYHGTYVFNRFLSIDVGDSFRHRIFASGSGEGAAFFTNISARPFPYTTSSTEHHFGYLGITYLTKPWKEFLNSSFAFAETGEVQNVDHHVATLCSAANVREGLFGCQVAGTIGYIDERPGTKSFYETTQGVTWIVPVDPKHGTTFTLNERWGYLNFYENTPYPWRWCCATVEQLSKRFSPGFTLALRHQDLHELPVGAPFPAPSVVHVGSWDVIGTFHLDTNSLFH